MKLSLKTDRKTAIQQANYDRYKTTENPALIWKELMVIEVCGLLILMVGTYTYLASNSR